MTHSAPGGLREIWNDIAGGLEERGHDTCRFVLYPDGLRGDGKDAQDEGWHHVCAGRPAGPLGMLKLMWETVRWLRQARPAVVVTAMPLANVVVALAATLARTGTKVVATHHSPSTTHSRGITRLDSITGRLPAVARIVAVSRAVAASFEGKSRDYRKKLQVIHNALPQTVETLLETLRRNGAVPRSTPGRCVAVGRLSYQKNYPLLLRAFAQMHLGSLEIIGGGEDEAALRAMARDLGVADKVTFAGQLSRTETLHRCAGAQVFVQVSHYEGHSLALIEAARLGLPLVVSCVPVQIEGITDAAGQLCGLTVPLTDAPALASVLTRLLGDDGARAHWSERARHLGLEISSRTMVDRYETLLSEVAS